MHSRTHLRILRNHIVAHAVEHDALPTGQVMDKAYEDDLEGSLSVLPCLARHDSSLPGLLKKYQDMALPDHDPMTYRSQTDAISKALS